MSVPKFNEIGVIPPFIGSNPAQSSDLMTPYKTNLSSIVDELGTSQRRRQLLRNLIDYRAAIRASGVRVVCQWVAGSFVENIDPVRQPKDIDLVTFHLKHPNLDPQYRDLFHRGKVRQRYELDSFFVRVDDDPLDFIEGISYWLGLFSHRRDTFEWKGVLQIELDDDSQATSKLGSADAE